jgi:hypothetical protein
MRIFFARALAALACAAAVTACSDEPGARRAPVTAPFDARMQLADGAQLRLHGGGSASVATPQGVVSRAMPSWSAAGVVRRGIAQDEGGSSPFGVLGVAGSLRRSIPPEGGRSVRTFLDTEGNRVAVAFEFGADGAPMRSVRLYINGALRMKSEFVWAPARGGWTLQSSMRRFYHDGKEIAELGASSAGADLTASRRIVPDALAHLAAGAARMISPEEAYAGPGVDKCRDERLAYIAATAAFAAAIITVERNPANPVAWLAMIAAGALATRAELALWICEENQDSSSNPLGGGGGSGANTDPNCIFGYWMSSCQDPPPFTE